MSTPAVRTQSRAREWLQDAGLDRGSGLLTEGPRARRHTETPVQKYTAQVISGEDRIIVDLLKSARVSVLELD